MTSSNVAWDAPLLIFVYILSDKAGTFLPERVDPGNLNDVHPCQSDVLSTLWTIVHVGPFCIVSRTFIVSLDLN